MRLTMVWMFVVIACPAVMVRADTESPEPATQSVPPAAQRDLGFLLADTPGRGELLAARRTALEVQVDRAGTALEQVTACLTLANWLLAVPGAEAATRVLTGMPAEGDAAAIAALGQVAARRLAQAREAMEVYKQVADSASPATGEAAEAAMDRWQALTRACETLEAFASVFAAMGREGSPEYRQAAWAAAARGLATVRESQDVRLAACALLWQAFAWHQAGRPDRALALLPKALQPPVDPDYDFLARLLRCRILLERDQEIAVMALLGRVRNACLKSWFEAEAPAVRTARERLAALMQLRASGQWQMKLRSAGSHAVADRHAAAWAELALGLMKLPEADINVRAWRLTEAVPVLIEPQEHAEAGGAAEPAAGLTATSGTLITAPATAPAEEP